MKKSILMFAAALALFTACDPAKESGSLDVTHISADQLLANATFKQFAQVKDDEGNISYVEAEDGNYIQYNVPGVSGLVIYTLNADGSEFYLTNQASGGGMFSLVPRRGSDPTQTVYFRYINQEGEEVVATHDFTVYVPGDIAYELKLLASNDYGKKTWKWNTNAPDGVVWGNMGYCGGAGSDVALYGNGKWWGVTSEEEFLTQGDHTGADGFLGDESMDATMVFNEDGTVKCYDKDGNEFRSGTFEIQNYDDSDPSAWKVGDLVTSPGAILWPYEINSGGNKPTNFEIVYLSSSRLVLVYPDGGDFGSLGSWGEATFWQFSSDSDVKGMAAGYGEGKDWTWNTNAPDGVVWGNMGYCGGAGSDVGLHGNGKWWGVTSEEEFLTQGDHTGADGFLGDESMDAFMTLTPSGLISRCKADGSVINSGTYELEEITGNSWKVANLHTTAGTILWPYEINSGGNKPTVFEVVYLSDDQMTLVYPDGGDFGSLGNWGEASFWQFKKK